MVRHPFQPYALTPKTDERELHPEYLGLDLPGAELVSADEVLLGLQMGNLILAAVYDVKRIER